MGFLPKVWIILSLFLTGLGIFSTIQSFVGFDLASFPEIATESYRAFRDKVFGIVLEWFLPFSIPIIIKDIICLYGFCSISIYNLYKWNGNLEEWGKVQTILFAPAYILNAALHLTIKDLRNANPQYILFYFGHVAILLLYGVVAIIFLIWNAQAIQSV